MNDWQLLHSFFLFFIVTDQLNKWMIGFSCAVTASSSFLLLPTNSIEQTNNWLLQCSFFLFSFGCKLIKQMTDWLPAQLLYLYFVANWFDQMNKQLAPLAQLLFYCCWLIQMYNQLAPPVQLLSLSCCWLIWMNKQLVLLAQLLIFILLPTDSNEWLIGSSCAASFCCQLIGRNKQLEPLVQLLFYIVANLTKWTTNGLLLHSFFLFFMWLPTNQMNEKIGFSCTASFLFLLLPTHLNKQTIGLCAASCFGCWLIWTNNQLASPDSFFLFCCCQPIQMNKWLAPCADSFSFFADQFEWTNNQPSVQLLFHFFVANQFEQTTYWLLLHSFFLFFCCWPIWTNEWLAPCTTSFSFFGCQPIWTNEQLAPCAASFSFFGCQLIQMSNWLVPCAASFYFFWLLTDQMNGQLASTAQLLSFFVANWLNDQPIGFYCAASFSSFVADQFEQMTDWLPAHLLSLFWLPTDQTNDQLAPCAASFSFFADQLEWTNNWHLLCSFFLFFLLFWLPTEQANDQLAPCAALNVQLIGSSCAAFFAVNQFKQMNNWHLLCSFFFICCQSIK